MDSKLQLDIKHAQLEQLYGTRIYAIVTMFAGVLLVYCLMDGQGRYSLFYWLLYMCVVDVYRTVSAVIYYRHKKQNSSNDSMALKSIVTGTALSSIGWGASSLLLFPYLSHAHQIIFTAIIIGVSTGATTTLAYKQNIAKMFVILVISSFIISVLLAGNDVLILSIIMAVYMLFLLKNISIFYANNEKLLRLEFESQQREKELALQREKAVQANTAKSAFLANISHELRTPMHAILGFSELGINKINMAQTEKLHTYFSRIQESGQRLLDLLNDLLDISKFEAGRMKLEMNQQDLREAIDIVSEELGPLFVNRSQNIKLTVSGNTLAVYDAGKITRVIRNLLSNAIKFSPRDSRIELYIDDASLLVEEGNRRVDAVAFRVSDQGRGVPADELESVFDKFVQSARNKEGGGTGLGLSICYEIIHKHNGIIRAENNKNGGASFYFIIPREPLSSAQADRDKK